MTITETIEWHVAQAQHVHEYMNGTLRTMCGIRLSSSPRMVTWEDIRDGAVATCPACRKVTG